MRRIPGGSVVAVDHVEIDRRRRFELDDVRFGIDDFDLDPDDLDINPRP